MANHSFLPTGQPIDHNVFARYGEVLGFHEQMTESGQSGPMKTTMQLDGMDLG
jgi:p38 MAP kinase